MKDLLLRQDTIGNWSFRARSNQKSGKPCAEKVGCCARSAPTAVLGAKGAPTWLAPIDYRYVPKPLNGRQEQLYQQIIALSWQYPRYGYRRICALLAREGWRYPSGYFEGPARDDTTTRCWRGKAYFFDRLRNFRYVAHHRIFGKRGSVSVQKTTAQS